MRNEKIMQRFIHDQAIKQRLLRGIDQKKREKKVLKYRVSPPVPTQNKPDFKLSARPIILKLGRIIIH